MQKVINALIIEDNKLLLVKKLKVWIPPGGKPLRHESDIECLSREFYEELSGSRLVNISYYKQFVGTSPHNNQNINVVTYFASINGKLHHPSHEILEYNWFSWPFNFNVSYTTYNIGNSLNADGYL